VLIDDWESFEHYDRYLEQRMETGRVGLLDSFLERGRPSFRGRNLCAKNVWSDTVDPPRSPAGRLPDCSTTEISYSAV
jgi:hypothetical protein